MPKYAHGVIFKVKCFTRAKSCYPYFMASCIALKCMGSCVLFNEISRKEKFKLLSLSVHYYCHQGFLSHSCDL